MLKIFLLFTITIGCYGLHKTKRPSVYPTFKSGNSLQDCFQDKICSARCNRRALFRTLDGTCNNLRRKTWGATNTPLKRLVKADYADGVDKPRGFPGRRRRPAPPSAHEVSAAVFKSVQKGTQKAIGLSTIFMTFGQFLDHDMSISPHGKCSLKAGDPVSSRFKYPCFPILFKKATTSGQTFSSFTRSAAVCKRNTRRSPRNQVNALSSYIDGSGIYGSDFKTAQFLRRMDGTGKLKVDPGRLLPLGPQGNCKNPAGCSMAGDKRADENIALHAMHTIWLRYHNSIAKRLKRKHRFWRGEYIYQMARKITGAVLQHIVYSEFVPKLVKLSWYRGYKRKVDPRIANGFSTAAYRFGHSLVPNSWAFLNKNYDEVRKPVPLQNTFFDTTLVRQGGIENVVFGLLGNQSQTVDTTFARGIMKRLFVKPGANTHSDLTAMNIQRGRDHGLPTYGRWRKFCKLKPLRKFKDLRGIMSRATIKKFEKIYKHPNHIDLFAAGVAERHRSRKYILGETFQCIIKNQFQRLRDGDRFFYLRRNVFTFRQRREIKKMSLARVLCETLKGIVSVQKHAFVTGVNVGRTVCNSIPGLNINAFPTYQRGDTFHRDAEELGKEQE